MTIKCINFVPTLHSPHYLCDTSLCFCNSIWYQRGKHLMSLQSNKHCRLHMQSSKHRTVIYASCNSRLVRLALSGCKKTTFKGTILNSCYLPEVYIKKQDRQSMYNVTMWRVSVCQWYNRNVTMSSLCNFDLHVPGNIHWKCLNKQHNKVLPLHSCAKYVINNINTACTSLAILTA
jgi:hypothetical protein